MTTDLMVDWETWGIKSTAIIRAGALAEFYPATGLIKRTLLIDARHSVDNQIEHGRTIDHRTIAWWRLQENRLGKMMEESPNARTVTTLSDLAFMAIHFIGQQKYGRIWSRGHFDLPILASLFPAPATFDPDEDDNHSYLPWAYWQEADVRTLDFIAPKEKPEQPHNPLSDIQAQVRQVKTAYLQRIPTTEWRHIA